jgi:quercetin dioxygenase-like cupin family protein
MRSTNLDEAFGRVSEIWRPKVAARLNGQTVKLIRVRGTFPWHRHDDADELFLVWRGQLDVELREGVHRLGRGDFLVVPRGSEHRTAAEEVALVLVFEPLAVRNTGDVIDASFTAPDDADLDEG